VQEVTVVDRDADEGVKVEPGSETEAAVWILAVVVGVGAALIAAYARHVNIERPGVAFPKGFYGWSDQSHYLLTAQILSRWHLPVGASQYHFGLGYPVLAVPFIWLGFKGDPFAPADVVAYGAATALTFVLATRVRVGNAASEVLLFGLGAAVVFAVATPSLELAATPWNTNVDVALGLLILVIVTSPRSIGRLRASTLGLCVGWIFASRYVDALWLGVPVVVAFFLRDRLQRDRILVYGGACLFVIVGVVAFTHQHAFGSWHATPYQFHTRVATGADDQSINQYRLSRILTNFKETFLTGAHNGIRQRHDPLLREFPLLLLAPVGAVIVMWRRSPIRAVWIAAAITSGVATLFYLSFIAGDVGNLQFGNLRYWEAWYPLWSIFTMAALAFIATRAIKLAEELARRQSRHAT
jgi:hypothetical protein